jgi:hypothetical protein
MTAKIIRLTPPAVTIPTPPGPIFFDSARFSSLCPTCNDTRSQLGYSPRSLVRLLRRDRPIEAYCAVCNGNWPISPRERVRLASELELART